GRPSPSTVSVQMLFRLAIVHSPRTAISELDKVSRKFKLRRLVFAIRVAPMTLAIALISLQDFAWSRKAVNETRLI
ncbi:MAG TPA: hypothetical protein VF961_06595, partial [Pyrinomonadaceae bacterium]